MPDLHRAPTTRDPTRDLRVFPTSPSPGPVAPEWGDYGRHGGMHGGVGAPPPALPAVLVPSSPPKFVAVGIAAFGCGRERAHAPACASAHPRVYARGDGGGVDASPPTLPAVCVPLSPPSARAAFGGARALRVAVESLLLAARRGDARAARHSAAARRGDFRLLR